MFQFLKRLLGGPVDAISEGSGPAAGGGEGAAPVRPPVVEPPRSDLVGPPEADTPLVVVARGGVTMIIDRMGYEYQEGLTPGDPPSQESLDQILGRATRVRALDGGMYREEALGLNVLFEELDPAAVRGLIDALRISEDPATFAHGNGLGGPTLEFFDEDGPVAAIAIHHGGSLRWPAWKHDAALLAGRDLANWMAARGVELGDTPTGPDDPMMMGSLSVTPADRLAARAESYFRLGLPARALAELDAAQSIDPELAVIPPMKAEALFRLGRFDEGLAAGEEAIARGYRDPRVLQTQAACLNGLGRPEEALARVDEAIELDPALPEIRNTRGTILGRLGRIDEARAEFDEAGRLAPDWVLPPYHLAMTDFLGGRPAQAIESFTRTIELLESSGTPAAAPVLGTHSIAALHSMRAGCRIMLGELEAALADSDRATEMDPDDPDGHAQKGRALLMLGRPGDAVDAFESLARLAPEHPMAWTYLAHARAGVGDFEAGLAAIAEAMRLEPENPHGPGFKAQVLLNLDRPEEALEAVDAAIGLRPDDAGNYMLRARCRLALGDFAGLMDDLKTARRWSPDDPMALNNLAWYLSTVPVDELRDGPQALSLAMRAADLTDGRDADVLGTLAAALAENGKFAEARKRLDQAIALAPAGYNNETRQAMRLAFDEDRPYRI